MALLLHEPLPLRSTRMLGDFADDRPLAQRYGDLTRARFRCLRLSDVEFFVADHPFTVTGVFVADERTLAYEAALDRDDDGHTWTVVRFSAPVPPDAVVSATGRGKLDPVSGALIENPADIMADLLRLAGKSDAFPAMRAQAAAEGLRLAGSIDAATSIRAALDEVARSAGAMWIPGASVLYPSTDVGGPIIDLERTDVVGLDTPTATLDDTADELRIAYDRADVTGRAQHSMALSASPKLYGGVAADVFLPWLRIPANAETVGRRLLQRMAGRRYAVPLTVRRTNIRPCQRVRIVNHPAWHIDSDADPVAMILDARIEPGAGSSALTGEVLLSTPTVTVTAHSVGLTDTSEGGADVEFRNGVATFTIRDEDGKPLMRARVTLDGGDPKLTDERGQVSFATVAGPHELLIEREGYATQRIEFEL